MARPRGIPIYRKHRQSGQAVVTLTDSLGSRKDVLLGKHNSPESQLEYTRVIVEWEASGRQLPTTGGTAADLTVNELLLRYVQHADGYYRKPDGTPTSELDNIKQALRWVKQMYGHQLAVDFDSLAQVQHFGGLFPWKIRTYVAILHYTARFGLQVGGGRYCAGIGQPSVCRRACCAADGTAARSKASRWPSLVRYDNSAKFRSPTASSSAAAAKRFPSTRWGRPVNLSCVLRWVLDGVLTVSGERVRLEAARNAGRWVTTAPAIRRFLERQNSDAVSSEAVDVGRTPGKRQRASERAAAELERVGN